MDKIYTPENFARTLISGAFVTRPLIVADFAVGDGALLAAAQERWPLARLYGFDIDQMALENLCRRFRNVEVSQVDFLEDSARRQCDVLASLSGKCDLVLLNPPFSCRGNTSIRTDFMDKTYECSKAFAFFVRSLEYISATGEIVAILPKSCLNSQRDRALYKSVSRKYNIQQIGNEYKSVFRGRAVSVLVIKASALSDNLENLHTSPTITAAPPILRDFSVEILRGTFPVHLCSKRLGSFPLIHTTELKNGEIVGEKARVVDWPRSVSGTSLLLPRIGKPDPRKIVFKSASDCVVISDCIYALATKPRGFERVLMDQMTEHWDRLGILYSGSCAPYLTVESLRAFLSSIGLLSDVVACIRGDAIDAGSFVSNNFKPEIFARSADGVKLCTQMVGDGNAV